MPVLFLKPSNSTKRAFNVLSLSLEELSPSEDLFLPTASISSTKIIHGTFFLANPNNSFIRDGPTPTYFSWKSDPDTDIKLHLDSPASAFANNVLPVPGGPSNISPLGILTLNLVYFW